MKVNVPPARGEPAAPPLDVGAPVPCGPHAVTSSATSTAPITLRMRMWISSFARTDGASF